MSILDFTKYVKYYTSTRLFFNIYYLILTFYSVHKIVYIYGHPEYQYFHYLAYYFAMSLISLFSFITCVKSRVGLEMVSNSCAIFIIIFGVFAEIKWILFKGAPELLWICIMSFITLVYRNIYLKDRVARYLKYKESIVDSEGNLKCMGCPKND